MKKHCEEERTKRVFTDTDSKMVSCLDEQGNGINHRYYPRDAFLTMSVHDSGKVSKVILGYENKEYVKQLTQVLKALSAELDREDLKRKETLSELKERVNKLYRQCKDNGTQLSSEELDLMLYTLNADDFGGNSSTSVTFVAFHELLELFKRYEREEDR